MNKLFILKMLQTALVLFVFFVISFFLIGVLEIGLGLKNDATNFVSTVLFTVFMIPVLFFAFFGIMFFSNRIENAKQNG